MIATLSGKLKSKSNNQIVLDVNGVGYCLHVSKNTLDHIGKVDDLVILNTELQVRDDSILLYGFKHQSELNMFKLLQSIQGIGPRAALAVLSALTVEQIIISIKSSDKSTFQKADGIGQRVATRIVSELQEKIDQFSFINSNIKSKDLNITSYGAELNKNVIDDAISAIVNLGYSKSDVFLVVNSICNEIDYEKKLSIEKIIPLALKKLSK
ncbi:Holliday junction branch migration protein RuvA [Alphaproteobacteria bacterium]|nr:Holliday junction branch migration protein RuvA [Alphaproteobacteria bacterium]